MTIKEMYEEAIKNGWENLPVMVFRPGTMDCYGNRTLPAVAEGNLVHRNENFWAGLNTEFLAII